MFIAFHFFSSRVAHDLLLSGNAPPHYREQLTFVHLNDVRVRFFLSLYLLCVSREGDLGLPIIDRFLDVNKKKISQKWCARRLCSPSPQLRRKFVMRCAALRHYCERVKEIRRVGGGEDSREDILFSSGRARKAVLIGDV